jgi:twitching motility protein PilI
MTRVWGEWLMGGGGVVNNESSLHPFDLLLAIDKRNHERILPAPSEAVQATDGKGQLAVRVWQWNLLFSMEAVAEIIPVPRITRVPGVKSWLLGIANLRGMVMAVVDLQAFLSGEPAGLLPGSRLLVVRSGEWHYGLLVDAIVGMRHFGPASRQIALDTVAGNLSPYITGAFASEDQHWLAFNLSRLLNAPEFLQAAR